MQMVDIEIFHKALKLTWFRRFFRGLCKNVEHLMKAFIKQPFLSYLGDDYYLAIAHEIGNPFWKEMIRYLALLFQANNHSFLTHPLWNNSKIRIDRSSIFLKKWNKKGIRFVNDLVDQEGRLLSRIDCGEKFNISLNFLQYFSVCQAIKCAYRAQLGQCSKQIPNPVFPCYIATVMSDKSVCSRT